ncbi:DUF4176 domain-containing protein [Oceanobacillus rekensis]|uniref:DUF4176 domain-containing protein n=1 Tax=Oceanobacillus rekensis TaxID=937927 RepID=UPI000B442E54|nr:DUF4176 domain-containing protein [Oceanobacillus rekensis]
MAETLLPNGTIVLLKNGDKKLMIYGRKQIIMKDGADAVYDYVGVPYPEGYIDQKYTYVFNHSSIKDIIFKGYMNDEEYAFQEVLNRA